VEEGGELLSFPCEVKKGKEEPYAACSETKKSKKGGVASLPEWRKRRGSGPGAGRVKKRNLTPVYLFFAERGGGGLPKHIEREEVYGS